MDIEYGVDTTNKFAFLMDDDHDPEETIAGAAVKAAEDKKRAELDDIKAKKAAAKKPVGAKAAKPDERKDGKENRGPPADSGARRGGGTRGGLRQAGGRGGRGGGNFREPRPEHTNAEDGVVREGHRGGPRGGQAFGGRGRRGRTDRQSGSDRTGVSQHDKRGGGGRGNWGTQEDQLTGETEKLDISIEKVELEKVVPPQTEREVEPEDKTMTLVEWKASQQTVTKPAFNERKVHATKAMKEIPTKFDYASEEEHVTVEKRAPKKQVVNIDINFAKSRDGGESGMRRGGSRGGGRGDFGGRGRGDFGNRGRGDFGGRGRGDFGGRGRGDYAPRGGRGDGGRGGAMDVRGHEAQQPRQQGGGRALHVDDLNSFPALG